MTGTITNLYLNGYYKKEQMKMNLIQKFSNVTNQYTGPITVGWSLVALAALLLLAIIVVVAAAIWCGLSGWVSHGVDSSRGTIFQVGVNCRR